MTNALKRLVFPRVKTLIPISIEYRDKDCMDLADAIKQFSDGPVDEIDENNMNLKCYMHCMFHSFVHYDESHEYDESDLFTHEETEILIDMGEKCDSYEYERGEGCEKCDARCELAFQLSKCWKMANPEVCIHTLHTFSQRQSFSVSRVFYNYLFNFVSVLFFVVTVWRLRHLSRTIFRRGRRLILI